MNTMTHDWKNAGHDEYSCVKCGKMATRKAIAIGHMICPVKEQELKERIEREHKACVPPNLRVVDIKPEKDIKNEIMEEAEVLINQRTVELLEEMLELAKDGHVVEVMLIGFRDDGCMVSSFTDTMDYIRRLGALEFLKYRFQSDDQEDT